MQASYPYGGPSRGVATRLPPWCTNLRLAARSPVLYTFSRFLVLGSRKALSSKTSKELWCTFPRFTGANLRFTVYVFPVCGANLRSYPQAARKLKVIHNRVDLTHVYMVYILCSRTPYESVRMPRLPPTKNLVRRHILTAKPGSQMDLAGRNVTMANVIVRSAFNLNLSEMRLLSAALANTDATDTRALTTESFWTVKLSAIDYAKTFKVSLDTAYEQMEKAADRLLRHLVVRPHPTRKGVTLKHQWLSRGEYEKGRGTVTLTWHEDIRPFVLGLRKEFTTYRLNQAAAFRSVYTWYLWNTLKSWQGIGRWSPSLEEFAVCMSAESYLGNFKEMRRRVLEPAVKELREKNNMEIVWEQITEGRKTVGLRFHFQHAKQGALDLGDAPMNLSE